MTEFDEKMKLIIVPKKAQSLESTIIEDEDENEGHMLQELEYKAVAKTKKMKGARHVALLRDDRDEMNLLMKALKKDRGSIKQ